MPHDHGHTHIDPESGDRRVSIAIWANGLLTVAQIVGGILGSLHKSDSIVRLVRTNGELMRRPVNLVSEVA